MNDTIVKQLVIKDLQIMRFPIFGYWLGGVLAILLVIIGGDAIGMMGFILFISVIAGAAIHAVMQTIVTERTEFNLPFIMSLPITVKEYTQAKIIANMLIFLSVWLPLSIVGFYVLFADGEGFPPGMIPFVSIACMAMLLGYVMLLTASLLTKGMAVSVAMTVIANVGTQMFLWFIADLHAFRSVMGGPVAVWNTTAVGILLGQMILAIGLLVLTVVVQYRRKDFV